jgi:hypothetical protein
VDRAPGAGVGDGLQHLAEQGDEDDLRRDERLAEDQRGDARLGQRDVGADPAGRQRLQRPVDDAGAAEDRRDQRQRDSIGSPPARQAEQDVAADQQTEHGRQDVQRTMVLIVRVGRVPLDGVGLQVVDVGGVVLAVHGAGARGLPAKTRRR